MFQRRKQRRDAPAVNAGSMADIAFLLLIFFLVTTKILEDQGILVRLPIWEADPPTEVLADRNVLTVKINAANQLLVEGDLAQASTLRETTKRFIINPSKSPLLAISPTKAVVSLQNDRGTQYETYLAIYNEIVAAYNELWEELAQANFGEPYEELNKAQRKSIRNEIPMIISEADPTSHGDVVGT
jgi:biopolymer transport protein ExbD